MGNDRKVILYALQSDFDPLEPTYTVQPIEFDVYGKIGFDLFLGGTQIFSSGGYAPISFQETGLTDFMPSASLTFIMGQNPQNSESYWSAPTFLSFSTLGLPANHLNVSELFYVNEFDAPASATAVDFTVSAGAGSQVLLEDLNVSLVAVAAQAASVTLTITEDNGGTPVVIFQKSYIAPAGTCINDNIRLHMTANVDARVQITAPAATNFVSANLRWNGSLTDPGIMGEGPV